jgi:hypothetical protein
MLNTVTVTVALPALLTIALAAAQTTPVRLLSASEARSVRVTESDTQSPDGVRLYYRVAGSGDEVVIAPFALYHGTRWTASRPDAAS